MGTPHAPFPWPNRPCGEASTNVQNRSGHPGDPLRFRTRQVRSQLCRSGRDTVHDAVNCLSNRYTVNLFAVSETERHSAIGAVLFTGDELVEPGQSLEHGQIFDANSWMLTAAAREAGAIAYRVPFVPDDPHRFTQVVEDQLVRADLVITSGGVSKGAYDIVKSVLGSLGDVHFDEVAMQPGKPQGYGTIGPDSTPIVSLPGNPVSSYVSFENFVRPVIRTMLGASTIHRPAVKARLEKGLSSTSGVRSYVRGILSEDGKSVVPLGSQDEQATLSDANAFIAVPEGEGDVAAGSEVTVVVLERRYI